MNIPKFGLVDKQKEFLVKILKKNKLLLDLLKYLQKLDLPNWYVGGGAIPQMIWNHAHGYDLNNGIKDFDIVYFDPTIVEKGLKIVERKEHEIEKKLRKKFIDINIRFDVVNEAGVYLWFGKNYGKEIEQYSCTEEAITSFPTTASAIGISLDKDDDIKVFAPRGLTDLFGLIVRANKVHVNKKVYKQKCKRWKSVWPLLAIVPWDYKDY